MKKMFLLLALVALPAFATNPALFDRYETVRQALLRADVKTVQSSARDLASAAHGAKLETVAAHAKTLATASNIKDARAAFAKVSQEMITYRDGVSGKRPVVAYCSMEKKSWLQPSVGISGDVAVAGS